MLVCACNFNKEKKINFSDSNLNKYISNVNTNNYSTEIYSVIGNNIIGTIYDSTVENNILETKGLFIFNYETEDFKYINYEEKNRVIDFTVIDEIIYMIIVDENDIYKWKLESYNINTQEKNIIKDGNLCSLIEYPRLFNRNNKVILTVLKDYDGYSCSNIRELLVYSLNDNNLIEIVSEKSKDMIIYNYTNIKVTDDGIYYVLKDQSDENEFLYKYDYLKKVKEKIFVNDNKNYTISNFVIDGTNKYINLLSIKNRYSKIIYNNEELDSNKFLLFEESINDKMILTHNYDSSWSIYDIKENKLYDCIIENVESDIYPKYYVLNSNKIIVQTYNEKYLIGDLK